MNILGTARATRRRSSELLIPITLSTLVIAVPILFGTLQIQGFLLPSHLSVFSRYMASPLQLVIPLIATGLGCVGLYRRIGNRHLANMRNRTSVRALLIRQLLESFSVPFIVFAGSALVIFVLAFAIWPLLGDPFISPSTYSFTTASARAAEPLEVSYSQLVRFGEPVYGVAYAIWFGLGAGTYSVLSAACLLVFSNRVVALLIPIGLYLVETIVGALLGSPYFGLMYSLVPFGLDQVPILFAAAPTLLLIVMVAYIWSRILRHPFEIQNLR